MQLVKHNSLCPHHRYQLEVIFLFAFAFFLFFPYFAFLEDYSLDQNTWQWYLFIPWVIFYTSYSLYTRSKIKKNEYISPLKRPIAHWVLLLITLVFLNTQPTNLKHMLSLDLAFALFSVFLADSYWSFRENK